MTATIGIVSVLDRFPDWGAGGNGPVARSPVAVAFLDSSGLQSGATVITFPFDVVVKTHGLVICSKIGA